MTALWFWAVDLPPAPEPGERVLRYPATPQTLALVAYDAQARQQQRVSNAELADARRELDRRAHDENRLRQLQLRQLERQAQQEQEREEQQEREREDQQEREREEQQEREREREDQQEREREEQQERPQEANEQQTTAPARKQAKARGAKPQYDREQIKAEIRTRQKPTAPEMIAWCKDHGLKPPGDRQMARYIAAVFKEKAEQTELP
jgi:hypothetical protein